MVPFVRPITDLRRTVFDCEKRCTCEPAHRIEFSGFSCVSQLARSIPRCTAEAGNQALRCLRGLRSVGMPSFGRKQSKLENSFAAALFFQVPRARLQQIIERH